MVISSVSNDTSTLLQNLQATRAAATAATSKTESSAESSSSSATALYDTVDISEEGSAYADAQEADSSASSSSVRAENAELLNSLNTADDSGLSFIQQQEAALKASISASDLMGESESSDDSGSLFSDLTDLLSSYTQANANNTIQRSAGTSALGVDSTNSTDSTEDSDSSDTDVDLSDYTLDELRTMLRKGEITTAQYLTEISSRQEAENETESTETKTNTDAALGAVSE
ncbi:hypothetical protein OBV_29320 [Oscillibacter valericigenes Sjm18-20]|nr:hypothetical protein OBV_29320 [Oscillibacter valericigenes Sjm18-20]